MSNKRKTWRCFFCDEVFIDKQDAAIHFGVFDACEADQTACQLMKHQVKVVEYIRCLESEVRDLQSQVHNETHPLLSAIYDIQHEVDSRERSAEERGYAKGVAEMKAQGYCVEPMKHAT